MLLARISVVERRIPGGFPQSVGVSANMLKVQVGGKGGVGTSQHPKPKALSNTTGSIRYFTRRSWRLRPRKAWGRHLPR